MATGPDRPHTCVDDLGRTIQQQKISHGVEADIRSFFDKVNHEWMIQFLRHRIGDERIIRLIVRMLKSGIMEDGLVHATEEGTPQGSILSLLLPNIYLHYVLDLWFSRRVRRQSRGEAYYFRFADDFLACFQYKDDAERFEQRLGHWLEEFGRFAREDAQKRGKKPGQFTFLGFMHYCGKTKEGYFKLKRRTSRKKLGASLCKFKQWARKAQPVLRKGEMIRQARTREVGHLSYYAITDNSRRCSYYVYCATRILFQMAQPEEPAQGNTWEAYGQALAWPYWSTVRIRKDLNPCRRAEAY